MSNSRRTLKWRIRFFFGGFCQNLAFRLCDPHDTWMVQYYVNDRPHAQTVKGFYHDARAKARELKGKIIGHNVTTIAASDPPDHTSGADWWKNQ